MNSKLHIYNSLTAKKELFEPLNPPFVGLYACGPTVYSDVHLGNIRSFLQFDIFFRYLTNIGYKVRYVRNITDVGHLVSDADEGEDKIEKRARLEKIEPMEIVQKYTNGLHQTTQLYNLLPPSIEPTATGHIVEQIAMVQQILDNGFGYEKNGSVYFDLEKYLKHHDYGKLSGRKVEDLLSQTREELTGASDKNFFADFVIWKAASEETLMKWDSPWGLGVPGWHLECSVMSTKYLGEQFDIHAGGMDLKFPHHECEIAQNIGAGCKTPARYWMHVNMLTVNGTKMSKSLGNSFLPMELIAGDHPMLEQGYSPMTVRFFMLQTHYSSTLDFSNDALKAAEKGFARLMKSYLLADKLIAKSNEATETDKQIVDFREQCFAEMNDDFNTAKTIAVLFDMIGLVNKINDGALSVSKAGLLVLQETLKLFIEDILGLLPESENDSAVLEGVMQLVLDIRKKAREDKNWSISDKIRDQLGEVGIKINDGKDGASWEID